MSTIAKMQTVTINEVLRKIKVCTQCGHSWIQRSSRRPGVCPNGRCHNPRWEEDGPYFWVAEAVQRLKVPGKVARER